MESDRKEGQAGDPRSEAAGPAGASAPWGSGRFGRSLLVVGLLGLCSGPIGWIVTDELESNDDFCNACHLSPGIPLHIQIREDYDERPPAHLAALHAAQEIAGRPEDPAFRCIDCHGGVGFVGRARVKALAAKDAFWWVVGHFEEPTEMRWPLLDADCSQCHDAFATKGDEFGSPAFHDLPVHNVELGVACVECHASHESGGAPDAYFIRAAPVRAQCARCHSEYEDSQEGEQ